MLTAYKCLMSIIMGYTGSLLCFVVFQIMLTLCDIIRVATDDIPSQSCGLDEVFSVIGRNEPPLSF